MRGRGRLTAGRRVFLVVHHDDDEVRRLQETDGGQRPEVHQQRAVAVEHEHANVGPRERDTQAHRRGKAHAAPRIEILWPIPGGKQIVGGMPEARDNRRVAREIHDDASRFDSSHATFNVRDFGRRQAPSVRVPNAVFPAKCTVSAAASADCTVACGTPIESKIARTARPIGTCAAFHSPLSPRMLTTISAGI